MTEKDIYPEESIKIIHSMINTTKSKLADNGFLLIFWGWIVFISSIFNYTLDILHIKYGYIVWPILMPLGGIFTIIYSKLQNKKTHVVTYVDSYLTHLWNAFAIVLVISIFALPFYGIKSSYLCLMLLYGFVTYVAGGLLDFKALRIGAMCSFVCAIISIFVGDSEQLLCLSFAILGSYIIPGHLLNKAYKSQDNV